jgi:lysophospholipase L1-like esterase
MLISERNFLVHSPATIGVWLMRVLAGSALCLVLFACKSDATQSPLAPEAKVLAFGDSLTYGAGVLPEETYPAQLQALIQRPVINGGLSGELSGDGLKRLPIWLNEYEPKLLILCHGANDLLRSLSEEKAAENVRAMVKMARDRGIDVVLIAVPKFGLMRAPPTFYEDIAKEFDIPIERHVLNDIVENNSLRSDSVHPNAQGYRMIAQAIVKRLQKSGAL